MAQYLLSSLLAGEKRAFNLVRNLILTGLILIVCSGSGTGAERRILFTNLEVSEGIGAGEIKSIIQDKRGFMWFATQSGLNRYDGYEIRNFRHLGTDQKSLSADDISTICEDRQGWIWVGTKSQGLNRYDPANEAFIRIPGMGARVGELEVTSILETSDQALLFGTRGGLFLLDKVALVPKPLPLEGDDGEEPTEDYMVESLFEDSSGILWVGTRSRGLCRYDYEAGLLRSVWNGGVGVSSIAEAEGGILWVGTLGEGIALFDSGANKFLGTLEATGLPSPNIGPIFRDSSGTMWIGMRTGLCRYDELRNTFQEYRHESGFAGTPVRGGIVSIFEDKKRVLWLGGSAGGVSRFSLDGYWFEHYRHKPGNETTIAAEGVWAFLENEDATVWVGTEEGLDLFDLKTGKVIDRVSDESGIFVSALVRGPNGEVFVGTKGSGVLLLDPETSDLRPIGFSSGDSETRVPSAADALLKGTISALLVDNEGRLWAGTEGGGVAVLEQGGNEFEIIEINGGEGTGVQFISALEQGPRGTIWVGTQGGGLFHLDPRTGDAEDFTSWAAKRGVRSSLSSRNITALELAGRSLWVGTSHQGINRIDVDTAQVKKLEISPDHLPHRKIYGIVEDLSGLVWASTGSGLVRIDPVAHTVRSFDIHDGLQADVFHPRANCRKADGKLLFGGPNGFNIVDPAKLPNELVSQRPILTGLELFGERVRPSKDGVLRRPLALTDVLILPNDKAKRVAFTFATLSYATPHRSDFRFRLKGLEDGWTNVGKERRATYTGLEPGEYVFQVQSKLGDEGWSGETVSLPIKVLPPWYQTWWARASMALGGVLLVTLVVVLIVRSNLQRMLRRETELDMARSRAEAALSRQLQNAMLLEQTTNRIRNDLDGGVLFQGALEQLCEHLEVKGCRLHHFENASQLNLMADYRATTESVGGESVGEGGNGSEAIESRTGLDGEFPLNDPFVKLVLQSDRAGTIRELADGSCGKLLAQQMGAIGAESLAAVRTSYMGEANGLIILYHNGKREWKADEIKLLEAIAAQVGIALAQLEMAAKEEQQRKDLEEARKAADDANSAKSEFLAKMTHELRTPLNAILGFSRLLGEDSDTTERQLKIINIVNSSGEHLLDIINDVLEMSKIESGKMELHDAPFDLGEMLDSVENMLGHKARSQDLRFAVIRENDLPSVIQGDRGKLRQCLVNLLGNSLKFTDKGSVRLRVKAEQIRAGTRISQTASPVTSSGLRKGGDLRLHFVIEDTGKGIAESEIPKLFQKFVQTDSGKKSHQGTGLGLAITAYFVEMMGGEIEVESELGKGTEFKFSITCSTAEPGAIISRGMGTRRVKGLVPGQEPVRVLVAEDQVVNRMLLTKILRTKGFEVEEAENGAIAIAKWKSTRPHLIFMDQDMPIMKGSEATQAIIEQSGQDRPVIIALTAYALDEARASAMEAGCDDFLSKPFDKEELFEVIAKHISVQYEYDEQKVGEPALTA